MRLERQPDYWELRAYAGPDPITARPRYVSRTFRGGKREATEALAQLVAEVDSIESYRGIARKVAADRLGGKMIQDLDTAGMPLP